MGEAPLIVASNVAVMEACVDRLERSGVVIRRRWEPGTAPASTELVCAGQVDTVRDAEAALLAALGGAGIVAVLPEDDALSASFFEDLRRLGDVEFADESPQNPLERHRRGTTSAARSARQGTLGHGGIAAPLPFPTNSRPTAGPSSRDAGSALERGGYRRRKFRGRTDRVAPCL